jgi:hypothetical protein
LTARDRESRPGNALLIPETDRSIVNNGVKLAHGVDLCRDILRARYRIQVAYDNCFDLLHPLRALAALSIARMTVRFACK